MHDSEIKQPKVVKAIKSLASEWTAIVQFDDERDAKFAFVSASKANCIPIKSNAKIPHIESGI